MDTVKRTLLSLICLITVCVVSLLLFVPQNAKATEISETEASTSVFLRQLENPFQIKNSENTSHEISITQGDSYLLIGNITYSEAYKGDVSYIWEVSNDDGKTWIALDNTSSEFQINNTTPGNYLYRLTAKDSLGNSATETWTAAINAQSSTGQDPNQDVNQVPDNESTIGSNQVNSTTKTGDSSPLLLFVALSLIALTTLVITRKLMLCPQKTGDK